MWKKRIAFVLFYITLFFLPPGLITVFLIPPEAQPVFLSGLGNGQATFEADGEVSSGHSPPPTPSAAPAVTPTLTPSRNPTLSPIPSPTPSRNPTPSPIPSPTPSPAPSRVRLAFTGDLMVHDRQLENAYHRETDTYTFSDFVEIADYLQNADYTVGNLETTFADKDAGYGTYPLFNTPDAFADAIAEAGFDFVTTANNHCFDKREKGLIRTLEILDEHGIDHAGT
ncbi:MAG: CapA family protein, partial [Clostridiales bacterium]|nr:CapA family protein [Clostridiales bacterium]